MKILEVVEHNIMYNRVTLPTAHSHLGGKRKKVECIVNLVALFSEMAFKHFLSVIQVCILITTAYSSVCHWQIL